MRTTIRLGWAVPVLAACSSPSEVAKSTLPPPQLEYTTTLQEATQVYGETWYFDRYMLKVTNSGDYGAELFAPAPDLPPCGLNTRSSRTWVEIYGDGAYLYGFCGLSAPWDLRLLWFAIPAGAQPPRDVNIVLKDRRTGDVVSSNHLTFYGALYDFSPRLAHVRWAQVPDATSYTLQVDCCDGGHWREPDFVSTCTSWQPNSTAAGLTTNSGVFTFVGAQPGRWRIAAFQGGTLLGWGAYQYFRFVR